jgi:hypothetical protein
MALIGKRISKDGKRELRANVEDDGFIISEREHWNDYGRSRWNDTRIFVTRKELEKILEAFNQ